MLIAVINCFFGIKFLLNGFLGERIKITLLTHSCDKILTYYIYIIKI